MEEKQLNIYQKMLLATEKIGVVAKNLNVELNKSRSYKAVSEVDVINAVKPIEIELGIYSFPYDREVIETNILTNTKVYNGQETETKNLFMRIETVYRFVNVDKPDEYIDMVSYGDGVDSQDKAPGKAMTYADKYALLKAYKIQTGDDPDKDPSGELKGTEKASKPLITEKQIEIINKLYTAEQIAAACARLNRPIEEWTIQEASQAIAKKKEQK